MSPSRTADIGNFNSRFATIVDRNNGIQSENQRLREKLGSVQDAHTEEDRVKTIYESEIGEARQLLDLESNKKVKQVHELKIVRLELKKLRRGEANAFAINNGQRDGQFEVTRV